MSQWFPHVLLAMSLVACTAAGPGTSNGGASPPPVAVPSASPGATAEPGPTEAPSAGPSTAATSRVFGTIYDDLGRKLSGATVQVRDAEEAVLATQKTGNDGAYDFDGLPQLVPLQLTVTYPDATPRERGFILDVNPLEENFDGSFALSNKPEVVDVSPLTVKDLREPIVITFSEPMDRSATERSLALTADKAMTLAVGVALPVGLSRPDEDSAIFTRTHFTITWSEGDRVMTLTPKEGSPLLSQGDVFAYRLSLHYQGGGADGLKDSGGVAGRVPIIDPADGPFRIGSQGFQPYVVIKVDAEVTRPNISKVRFYPEESGEVSDRIRVTFDQPMRLLATLGDIQGGADGNVDYAAAGGEDVSAAAAAANYEISSDGGATWTNVSTFAGASATFDSGDENHKTVLIYVDPGENMLTPLDTVAVRFAKPVKAPSGKSVTTGGKGVSARVP